MLVQQCVIEELRDSVGPEICRELVLDAVLQTTDRLALIEIAVRRRDRTAIGTLAHDLISMPGQIGMTRLSEVSRDLAACAKTEDWPAILAVADRLLRVGRETLAVYPDLTV